MSRGGCVACVCDSGRGEGYRLRALLPTADRGRVRSGATVRLGRSSADSATTLGAYCRWPSTTI